MFWFVLDFPIYIDNLQINQFKYTLKSNSKYSLVNKLLIPSSKLISNYLLKTWHGIAQVGTIFGTLHFGSDYELLISTIQGHIVKVGTKIPYLIKLPKIQGLSYTPH